MNISNEVLSSNKFSNGDLLLLRMLTVEKHCFFFVYIRCIHTDSTISYKSFKSFKGLDSFEEACAYYDLLRG